MKTIGIAIPVYGNNNLTYTKTTILESLQNSTIKPTKVSLSISGANDIGSFENYDFELITTVNSDRKNAAQNRNIAANKLDTDIISFMDSDDLPHIQRNEFILNAFETSNTQAVVHNYEMGMHVDENYNTIKFNINDFRNDFYLDVIDDINTGQPWPASSNRNLWFPVHNAHVSVLKPVFENIKFNEEYAIERAEDSAFNKSLVQNGIKISIINLKLSWYRR